MNGPATPILCPAFALLLAALPCQQPGGRAPAPVQVFILAGQSNMQGHGLVTRDANRNGGRGSLEYLVQEAPTKERYRHLVAADGKWAVRDDVWVWYLGRQGRLGVGFGARPEMIGPELQFGHVLGDHFEAPVLLIKLAWGGKSLAVDFRPPSSGGKVGPYYQKMLGQVRAVLRDLHEVIPGYDGRGYRIAGFGWHQGWNDGCRLEHCQEYERNLANLIRDVRKDLGVADLPFVIADSGFGGARQKVKRRLLIRRAQAAPARYPEFRDTVRCVETAGFFRSAEVSPSRQGYHWNHNAETQLLIGGAMAKALLELIGRQQVPGGKSPRRQ